MGSVGWGQKLTLWKTVIRREVEALKALLRRISDGTGEQSDVERDVRLGRAVPVFFFL